MRKKNRTSPIILALLCAVGVHTVLFTDAGHRMQGAITESAAEKSIADTYLSVENNKVSLVLGKHLSGATKITASLLYDTTTVTLSHPMSSFGTVTEKDDSIILVMQSPNDIPQGSKLITWDIGVSTPESHIINLSDVQGDTTNWIIALSTRGTGAF